MFANCSANGDVPYAPQPLGFGSEAKSSGKYGTIKLLHTQYSFPLHFIMFTNQLHVNLSTDQGPYLSQPLESAAQGGPGAEYGMLSLLLQTA